jgi:hypothetical protein
VSVEEPQPIGCGQAERFDVIEGEDACGARLVVYDGELADDVSGAADGDDSRWLAGCDLDVALLDKQGEVAVLALHHEGIASQATDRVPDVLQGGHLLACLVGVARSWK